MSDLSNTLISRLRGFSFGSLLMGGIAGVLFVYHPEWFAGKVNVNTIILIGMLLGAGAQGLIERILAGPASFRSLYWKLVNMAVLGRLISSEKKEQILSQIIEKTFLGEKPGGVNSSVRLAGSFRKEEEEEASNQ